MFGWPASSRFFVLYGIFFPYITSYIFRHVKKPSSSFLHRLICAFLYVTNVSQPTAVQFDLLSVSYRLMHILRSIETPLKNGKPQQPPCGHGTVLCNQDRENACKDKDVEDNDRGNAFCDVVEENEREKT